MQREPVTHAWASSLGAVEILNRNTRARGKVRLYREDGTLDRAAAEAFMRIATSRDVPLRDGDARVPEPLDVRLVQLAVKASYHFGAKRIEIVSATRKGARGKHGTGEALDFALEGVRAGAVAKHLFGYPRVGVGIYTHPKTQYVHLDVRERGTHWLDGSPPGVTWREKILGDSKQAARDAAYSALADLPEAARTPVP